MSITPEGGWGDQQQPKQVPDTNERAQNVTASSGTPRRNYLTCKICDRGTLSLKSVHRMSVPVVAIGFILLIPSFIGMIFCGIVFVSLSVSSSNQPHQSTQDATFRKNCKEAFTQVSSELPGVSAPQYCECVLSTYKKTDSLEGADRTCAQEGLNGTLKPPNHDIDAFYGSDTSRPRSDNTETNLARVFGGFSALTVGIIFFVSGLLGWLLVMKKRVLQCDVCGAVVNAS
jgi:hypothetical protein